MTPNERLMKTVIEAWGKADMRPFQEAVHDDIVWKSAAGAENGKFVFGGVHRGRAKVVAHLSKISTAYFFSDCVAKEVVSKGESVWGLFEVQGTYVRDHDAPRKPFGFEMAFRWRVRDGKVVEAQTFFDTAMLLDQQGDLA